LGSKHSAGKGDTYRKVDYSKWSKNWDSIFGKKRKPKVTRKSRKTKS